MPFDDDYADVISAALPAKPRQPRPQPSSSTYDPDTALPLISKYESGDRNIPNYRYDKGHTAQGHYQITNTNWRTKGPQAGVDLKQYPSAMAAPKEVQAKVAKLMYGERGFADWAPFNPRLKAAIGRGEQPTPQDPYDDVIKAALPQKSKQQTKSADPYDDVINAAISGQTPPPQSKLNRVNQSQTPATSPVNSRQQSVPTATAALQKIMDDVNRATGISKPRTQPRQPQAPFIDRTIPNMQEMLTTPDTSPAGREREQVRQEVIADRAARRGTAASPTIKGLQRILSAPATSFAELARPEDENVSNETTERIEAMRAARRPEVQQLANDYRKQIRTSAAATNLGSGRGGQWTQELLAKATAGLSDYVAAGLRAVANPILSPAGALLTDEDKAAKFADTVNTHALALQQAAEAEGADRNFASKLAQDAVAGAISSAPDMAAMMAGLPAPLAFGAGGATRALGRNQSPEQVANAAGTSALSAAPFEIPVGGTGLRGAIKRAGTVGAGTTALELAQGRTPSEALKGGLTNAIMSVGGGKKPEESSLNRGLDRIIEQEQARVSPSKEVNIPERPETIKAQLDAVQQGTRPAVLLTKGERRVPIPKGLTAVSTSEGTFYYDPKQVSRETINAKVEDGTYGELLGHVQPKSEATTEAVVARAPDGTEIQSSAVSPENVTKQAEVMQTQYPEANVETGGEELAKQVIADRVAPHPPAFKGTKVSDSKGEPIVVYHGTNETKYTSGAVKEGDAAAKTELQDLARKHGIKNWDDVASVFERWDKMGMSAEQGITASDVQRARELTETAKTRAEKGKEEIGFDAFNMPQGESELGVHFGTKEQAGTLGEPFPFYLNIKNPLRLPDLGTWYPKDVIRAVRRQGVEISDAEVASIDKAQDKNAALRELLLSKGVDGIVYKNESEGAGDSYIALHPEQIASAKSADRVEAQIPKEVLEARARKAQRGQNEAQLNPELQSGSGADIPRVAEVPTKTSTEPLAETTPRVEAESVVPTEVAKPTDGASTVTVRTNRGDVELDVSDTLAAADQIAAMKASIPEKEYHRIGKILTALNNPDRAAEFPEVAADVQRVQSVPKQAAAPKLENDVFTFPTASPRRTITVFKNPTGSDLREIRDRFLEEYPNAPKGEPKYRTTRDAKGNEYVWMSGEGQHGDVEPLIRNKWGEEVNKNMEPRVESPDLVTKPTEVTTEAQQAPTESQTPQTFRSPVPVDAETEAHYRKRSAGEMERTSDRQLAEAADYFANRDNSKKDTIRHDLATRGDDSSSEAVERAYREQQDRRTPAEVAQSQIAIDSIRESAAKRGLTIPEIPNEAPLKTESQTPTKEGKVKLSDNEPLEYQSWITRGRAREVTGVDNPHGALLWDNRAKLNKQELQGLRAERQSIVDDQEQRKKIIRQQDRQGAERDRKLGISHQASGSRGEIADINKYQESAKRQVAEIDKLLGATEKLGRPKLESREDLLSSGSRKVSVPEQRKDSRASETTERAVAPPTEPTKVAETPQVAETPRAATPEPTVPKVITDARARKAKRAADKAEGIEYRRAGADPYEIIDDLLDHGWEVYSKAKPKFDEWAKEMRDKFGEVVEPHLKKVYATLTGAKEEPATATPQVETREPTVPAEAAAPRAEREPSTTAVKNASMEADRVARDLPELAQAEPRKAAEVHQRAIDANTKDPRSVDRLTEQALNSDKNFTDVETAQVRLRAQEIKNRESALLKEIEATNDPAQIRDKRAELDSLTNEFDQLSQATKKAGTEWGRAGVARQQAIDQDFSLVAMKARLKAAKGAKLDPKQNEQVEGLHKRISDLESQLEKSNEAVSQKQVQREIDRMKRQTRRTESRQVLDDEFAVLAQQFRAKMSVQAMGIDPTAVPIIAKMARNRIKAGVTDAAQLVDDIHAVVSEHVKDITKRDIRDAISGYVTEPTGRRSELEREVTRLRSEMKNLSTTEDVAAGKRTETRQGPPTPPRQGPKETVDTIRARYAKQIAEYERRIKEEDFSDRPAPRKVIDSPETAKLRDDLLRTKNQYNKLLERQKGGYQLRNVSGVYKAWLLSWVGTHAKNILGTGAYQPFDEISRIPAVIMDAGVSHLTGQRGISGPSPSAMLSSVMQAVKVGGQQAKEIMKHGATKEDLERHQYREIDFGVNTGKRAIDQGVKAIELAHNVIFRFMSASDRVFYQGAYKRNLVDRARIAARNEGLKGEALSRRAKALEDSEQIQADAKHDALVNTFNNDNVLSSKIKGARGMASESKFAKDLSKKGKERLNAAENLALDLVLPFDRTPTNVVTRIVEASPVGYLKNAGQLVKAAINRGMSVEDQRQFSQTFGRATAGTALIGLGWKLAGSVFDTDDKGNVVVKLGSHRVRLDYLSPIANLVSVGVKLRQNHDAGKNVGAADAKVIGREITNVPLLRATSQLAELGQDPARTAAKTGARYAFTGVPFNSAVRNIGQVLDPKDRKAKGFKEEFQKNFPVWRESLPENVNRKDTVDPMIQKFRSGRLGESELQTAVDKGTITEAEAKRIKHEGGMSIQEADFSKKKPQDAFDTYQRLSPSQRERVREIMEKKAWSLLYSDSMEGSATEKERKRAKLQQQFDRLGIEPKASSTNRGGLRGAVQSAFA